MLKLSTQICINKLHLRAKSQRSYLNSLEVLRIYLEKEF